LHRTITKIASKWDSKFAFNLRESLVVVIVISALAVVMFVSAVGSEVAAMVVPDAIVVAPPAVVGPDAVVVAPPAVVVVPPAVVELDAVVVAPPAVVVVPPAVVDGDDGIIVVEAIGGKGISSTKLFRVTFANQKAEALGIRVKFGSEKFVR